MSTQILLREEDVNVYLRNKFGVYICVRGEVAETKLHLVLCLHLLDLALI